MVLDTSDFDQQLTALLTGTAHKHLDMTERLSELGRRMVDQSIATDRVLEMLTPLEPLPQTLSAGEGAKGEGIAKTSPPSIPAPEIPAWGDARQDARQNFAWPQAEEPDDAFPRIAQELAKDRGWRA